MLRRTRSASGATSGALRELEETRERLEAAVDAGDVGTFRVDLEQGQSTRDAALNRILGAGSVTTVEPLDGLAWVHEDDRERVQAALDGAIRGGGSFSIDCRVTTHHRSFRWVRGKGRALGDDTGWTRWVTGALVDVTHEHELSEERERLLDEARRARAEAEAAGDAKEHFLALVSHELRGPLHAMLGWLEQIRIGELDGEGRERALDTVERNARTQLRLIDDLLDITRVLSGKLRLDAGVIDLATVAEEAVQSWQPAALARSIDLRFTSGSGPVMVLGDADRLQQVVSNLVGNAIKFSPRGGSAEVSVECVRDEIARVSVRDTGPGIAPEVRERMFERFAQGLAHGATRSSGLGIGLPLVKDLVELHGGTVRAEDGENGGATLIVELPLRQCG